VVTQEIPAQYNGLIYVLKGRVKTGGKILEAEQAGWLDNMDHNSNSQMDFEALENETRFVLYAGQPHNVPVVHHGPFVAGTMEEISGLYKAFRQGAFPHLNDLPAEQRISYVLEKSE